MDSILGYTTNEQVISLIKNDEVFKIHAIYCANFRIADLPNRQTVFPL